MKKEHQNFWWYSFPLCRRAGLIPDNRPQRAGRIFPGSRFSPDALFLPVALCHADSVHRAHILSGSRVTECLPGSGGMVLPVVVILNPAEPGACSRIQAGTGPVRGVPELCAGLMQRAYGRGAPSPAAEGSADGAARLYWGGNRTVTRSPSPLPSCRFSSVTVPPAFSASVFTMESPRPEPETPLPRTL